MNIKQKIISHITNNIDLKQNKRVLLCGSDAFCYRQLQMQYPEANIACLKKANMPAFIGSLDIPEEDCYECIVDMGLLELCQWETDLIRAMGRHLSVSGRLGFSFHNSAAMICSASTYLTSYFDIIQKMYGNFFSPGGLLGVGTDGSAVSIANWGSGSKKDFPFYIGIVGDFDKETDWLQSFYTDDVRWELSCLLNRIEYDIDVEENTIRLAELCRTETIDAIYLERFVKSVACDVVRVGKILLEAGIIGGR